MNNFRLVSQAKLNPQDKSQVLTNSLSTYYNNNKELLKIFGEKNVFAEYQVRKKLKQNYLGTRKNANENSINTSLNATPYTKSYTGFTSVDPTPKENRNDLKIGLKKVNNKDSSLISKNLLDLGFAANANHKNPSPENTGDCNGDLPNQEMKGVCLDFSNAQDQAQNGPIEKITKHPNDSMICQYGDNLIDKGILNLTGGLNATGLGSNNDSAVMLSDSLVRDQNKTHSTIGQNLSSHENLENRNEAKKIGGNNKSTLLENEINFTDGRTDLADGQDFEHRSGSNYSKKNSNFGSPKDKSGNFLNFNKNNTFTSHTNSSMTNQEVLPVILPNDQLFEGKGEVNKFIQDQNLMVNESKTPGQPNDESGLNLPDRNSLSLVNEDTRQQNPSAIQEEEILGSGQGHEQAQESNPQDEENQMQNEIETLNKNNQPSGDRESENAIQNEISQGLNSAESGCVDLNPSTMQQEDLTTVNPSPNPGQQNPDPTPDQNQNQINNELAELANPPNQEFSPATPNDQITVHNTSTVTIPEPPQTLVNSTPKNDSTLISNQQAGILSTELPMTNQNSMLANSQA